MGGQVGMPVTFSVQINSETVSATAFAVETSSGKFVTPLCATLRPALESLEQRTVLLIGPFSPEDSLPVGVEIVEQLEDIEGNSLLGLRSEKVTALAAGPSLVFAERFAPSADGRILTYEIIVTDPGTFTEPVLLERHWVWEPTLQRRPYNCVWERNDL